MVNDDHRRIYLHRFDFFFNQRIRKRRSEPSSFQASHVQLLALLAQLES